MSRQQALEQALAQYQNGRFADAVSTADRALVQFPGSAELLHLKAVSLRKTGNLPSALQAMEAATKASPENPEMRNTFGNMLNAAGRRDEAEIAFNQALDLKPDYAPAYKNLITLYLNEHRSNDAFGLANRYVAETNGKDADAYECLGRSCKSRRAWHAAIAAFENCLKIAPAHMAGRYGLASVLLEVGEHQKSAALCDRLMADGQTAPQILRLKARALMEQGLLDIAEAPLMQAIGAGSPEALKDYTNLLWMTDRKELADEVLAGAVGAAGARPHQAAMALDEWIDMERPEQVVAHYARLPQALQHDALFITRLSIAKDELGETEDAFHLAEAAYTSLPDVNNVAYQFIQASLMSGRYDKALEEARKWEGREPLDQNWIALKVDALRMLGRTEEFQELMDFDRFVKPAQLPLPDGYASLDEFHADFIEQVHGKSAYKTHPLGQSARQGIQSPMNLMFDERPVVQNYIKQLYEPVQAYVDALGHDPNNPITARNTGQFHINGVWSIYLLAGGRHVSHTHPHGWISSAYYMAVPPEADTDPDRAGWIKFGEPPYKMPDPAPALHWVKPTPGTLVLFPAYMWHGTVPISGVAPRVTAPLDILPGAAP
ncbi:MAG: hypothetical protein CMK07_02060 [Ponticaulis sp.]|nr:hypothetical protein [Ponticaulis sp.]